MKRQLLVVMVMGISVGCLPSTMSGSVSVQDQITSIMGNINEIVEKLSEDTLSSAQQVLVEMLNRQAGRSDQTEMFVMKAQQFLDVLNEKLSPTQKKQLEGEFAKIESRIKALTAQEQQPKEMRQVGKLAPVALPPAPPVVAPKPQKTPPPVVAKPKKTPPAVLAKPKKELPLLAAPLIQENQEPIHQPAEEPVVNAPVEVVVVPDQQPIDEPAMEPLVEPEIIQPEEMEDLPFDPTDGEVIEEDIPYDPTDGEVIEEDPLFDPTGGEVVQEGGQVEPIPVEVAAVQEPLPVLAEVEEMPQPMPFVQEEPAQDQPLFDAPAMQTTRDGQKVNREAVLERVFEAQIQAAKIQAAQNRPVTADKEFLLAGIQQIPGFQFLDPKQQAVFNPGRKGNAYQKTMAIVAANFVIDALQGTQIDSETIFYYLGKRYKNGFGDLNEALVTMGLRRTIRLYVQNKYLSNDIINQTLLNVSLQGKKVFSVPEEQAKNAFEDAVNAILSMDELYAEQLKFASDDYKELMSDLEALRNEGRGNRDDLSARAIRLLGYEGRLDRDYLPEYLERILYLNADQRGIIIDVLRNELADDRAVAGRSRMGAESAYLEPFKRTILDRLSLYQTHKDGNGGADPDRIWKDLFNDAQLLTLYHDITQAKASNPESVPFLGWAKDDLIKHLEHMEDTTDPNALSEFLRFYTRASYEKFDREYKVLGAIIDKYKDAFLRQAKEESGDLAKMLWRLVVIVNRNLMEREARILPFLEQKFAQYQHDQGALARVFQDARSDQRILPSLLGMHGQELRQEILAEQQKNGRPLPTELFYETIERLGKNNQMNLTPEDVKRMGNYLAALQDDVTTDPYDLSQDLLMTNY